MARYRFALNGGPYSEPARLTATLLKVRERDQRDGPGFKYRSPDGSWSRAYKTKVRHLLGVARGLRRAHIDDLSKVATRCTDPTLLGRVYLIKKVANPQTHVFYPTSPVYDGMPSNPTSYQVGTGIIFCGGACKDDYANMDSATIHGQSVRLQRPAMDSFAAAAASIGGIKLTGSWRSCDLQSKLWAGDPNRYAAPATTAHPRGLAIDVDTSQFPEKQSEIHAALSKCGWFQARPTDEPWHYSYGIKV